MVPGPGAPLFGVGSAELSVVDQSDRQALVTLAYQGTPLKDIYWLSYWTYETQANNAAALPFQFAVSFDGSTTYNGRFVFEPGTRGNGAIQAGSWQPWRPLTGKWWNTKLVWPDPCSQGGAGCTWSDILTRWPNATIQRSGGVVLFKAGGGWNAWTGNVDGFTIGAVGRDFTTYDFEPAQNGSND
jgi:hypothetical protein